MEPTYVSQGAPRGTLCLDFDEDSLTMTVVGCQRTLTTMSFDISNALSAWLTSDDFRPIHTELQRLQSLGSFEGAYPARQAALCVGILDTPRWTPAERRDVAYLALRGGMQRHMYRLRSGVSAAQDVITLGSEIFLECNTATAIRDLLERAYEPVG